MARVCEFGEAALEQHIDWPIPENCVLVEYFCLPTQSFTRFTVIHPTKKHTALQRCLPFNSPLKKGAKQGTIMDAFSSSGKSNNGNDGVKSEHNEWDPDRMTAFYNAMKTKYNIAQARAVADNCRKVAKQFLK
jgi:hypothetical protein